MNYDETEAAFAEESIEPELPGSNFDATDPEDESGFGESGDDGHSPIASPGGGTETDPEAGAVSLGAQIGEESGSAASAEALAGLESVSDYEPNHLSEVSMLLQEGGEESGSGEDEFAEAVDAYFASQDETQQEFFGALFPALAPILGKAGKALIGRIARRRARRRVGRYHVCPRPAKTESGEAEAGTLMEVVLGQDDRVRIGKTANSPWNGICQLGIRAKNGSRYFGTGWLIGPRTVITAGHCVYLHNAGGWAKSIDVAAGRNGLKRPFGTITSAKFASVRGWVKGRNRSMDYGVIQLSKPFTRVGSTRPFAFDFAALSDDKLKNSRVNLSGYPADSFGTGKDGTKQWFHARRVSGVSSRTFKYDIDTGGGQSGSPVWVYDPKKRTRVAVGIHTNGFYLGNSATRLTPTVVKNLRRWQKAAT